MTAANPLHSDCSQPAALEGLRPISSRDLLFVEEHEFVEWVMGFAWARSLGRWAGPLRTLFVR